MSEIEFVLVAFSIMLALAFAKLIQGILRGATSAGRYWIHIGWCVHRLCGAVLYFWAFKALLDTIDEFTFYLFISAIFSPALFYAQALLLCPEQPESVQDWKQYFEKIRIPFFVIYIVIMLGNLNAVTALGVAIPLFGFVLQFLTGVIGIVSSNERVHAGLVVVNFVALFAAIGLPIMNSV